MLSAAGNCSIARCRCLQFDIQSPYYITFATGAQLHYHECTFVFCRQVNRAYRAYFAQQFAYCNYDFMHTFIATGANINRHAGNFTSVWTRITCIFVSRHQSAATNRAQSDQKNLGIWLSEKVSTNGRDSVVVAVGVIYIFILAVTLRR